MFLKSIEIRGFKSFADKTDLTFKEGVTVVVGPNGSGKSNISDAVRWVLGEQSIRNLRGDKMEDVIFAGTQYRKPVGLAQVSLTLDNSDSDLDIAYSQVTVSRRLYRSGESEYLINNTTCRLKDVQALFMDTGIGKEGYSIIGQGKIDAILSAKSEDRRKLLEEAAGIVKYKTRKEEAEKKLENTEQNLIRINDILTTYEERLPSLETDSLKAKKFLALSEEVKVKEVNIIVDFLEKTKANIDSINKEVEKVNKAKEDYNLQKKQLREELEQRNDALDSFSNLVEDKKKHYYETQSKHQGILSDVKLFEEKISYLKETEKRILNENNQKLESIDKEEKNILSIEERLSNLRNKERSFIEKIKSTEKDISEMLLSVDKYNNKIKELDSLKNNYNMNINAKNSEIGILNNNIQLTNETIEKLILDVQTFKNAILINNKTNAYLIEEEKKLEKKITEYEETVKINRKKLLNLKQELDGLEKDLLELNKAQSNKEARLHALTTLENSYEGYNKSVKLLMEYVNESKDYSTDEDCFVMGDVLKVPEKVERAIEISMGGNISNIITKNEKIAKDLVNHLKNNKLGRATFMPMDIVKGKIIAVDEKVKNTKGYVGIASELISYDEKFRGVIEHVLGKTIICDDMNSGSYISKLSNYKYRIVTLDGEVFNLGGTLTGGSYSKNANVIGRKREIEELKKIVKTNEQLIENKNNEKDKKYNEIKTLDDEGLNLRDEIHYENINITKLRGEMSKVKEEEERNYRELQNSKDSLDKEKKKLEEMEKTLKDSKEVLRECIEKTHSFDEEYEDLNHKVKGKNEYCEELKEKLTALRVNEAKILEIISSNEADLLRIKTGIAAEKQCIENNKGQIEILYNEVEEYKRKIEKSSDSIKEAMMVLNELEEFFKEAEVEKIKLKEKLPIISAKLEDVDLQLEKLEKEIHKGEIALTKIEAEEEGHLKKLNEEYNITFAEGLTFKLEGYDINVLKNQVLTLKKEISDLGIVNLGAIEEYKDVNEKYTFMNSQREDLVKSKEEIEAFIAEMTETMRKVFVTNFKQLREYFDETFKELFKGGSADLTLQGDDELNCKIDINVEPPGKKLQNINLLSGGEKVLSAIALLFAILKMKPTPFCILDEIEAALDDANVLRYGEFLKKFSKHIQFIVITHRKGTMETSDAIYGVTMEEKGVSKVVSLELTK